MRVVSFDPRYRSHPYTRNRGRDNFQPPRYKHHVYNSLFFSSFHITLTLERSYKMTTSTAKSGLDEARLSSLFSTFMEYYLEYLRNYLESLEEDSI